MKIGTRVVYPEEVQLWEADFLQISVYSGFKDNLELLRKCAQTARDADIRYVVHPVGYSLLKESSFEALRFMAEWADIALILHDEKTPDGGRIEGNHEVQFKSLVEELRSMTTVSFENATDTGDVQWFWSKYADSVTLDVGHVESFGLDSVSFVHSLDEMNMQKIDFVHMHRNNGWRGGLTDHWPLSPDCREVKALKELLKKKPDAGIILEINETEMIGESLKILRDVRDKLR